MKNRYSVLLEEDNKPIIAKAEPSAVQKTANPQADKSASPQITKSAYDKDRKSASPPADIPSKDIRERYSTRLLSETIKAMRIYAIEHDIKDYEVVEQAFKLLQEEDKAKSPQVR